MIVHAITDLPNECCGMIIGLEGTIAELRRARNEDLSPFRYRIHRDDLIAITREYQNKEWDVLAVYHSHVGTVAEPSPTDIRLSQFHGGDEPVDIFPGAKWIIISLMDMTKPVLRAFDIVEGNVIGEVPIEIPDEGRVTDSA